MIVMLIAKKSGLVEFQIKVEQTCVIQTGIPAVPDDFFWVIMPDARLSCLTGSLSFHQQRRDAPRHIPTDADTETTKIDYKNH